MLNNCSACHFDWERNPYGLTFEVDVQASAQLALYCPQCGAALPQTTVDALGVVSVDGQLYQWADRRSKDQVSLVMRGGSGPVPTLGTSNLFYAAVPAFKQADGSIRVPELPIKGQYRALVDWDRYHARPEDYRGKVVEGAASVLYTSRVPLKGRATAFEWSPPVKGDGGWVVLDASKALPGFELTLWPKIRSTAWKTFLVDARWIGPGKDALDQLEQAGMPFRASYGPGGDLVAWTAIGVPYGRNVRRFVTHTARQGRPQAIEVSFGDGAAAFGGLFTLDAPIPTNAESRSTVKMGFDLGTSNSCVAVEEFPNPAIVQPPEDLHLYLVRSRPAGDSVGADDWMPRPSSRGFGPEGTPAFGTIYPTELVLAQPAQAVPTSLAAKAPGLDYALAGPEVDWVSEGKPVAVETVTAKQFKWLDADGGAYKAEPRAALLTAYTKALLVQQTALLLARKERSKDSNIVIPLPAIDLDLFLASPARWRAEDRTDLQTRVHEALEATDDEVLQQNGSRGIRFGLRDWVDIAQANVAVACDEATAAWMMMEAPTVKTAPVPKHLLTVVADVGGGSTDIAMLWCRPGSNKVEDSRVEYLTSFRFAGEDLFAVLAGPPNDPAQRCLSPGLSNAQVAHRLRTSGAGKELFHPSKEVTYKRRIKAFYGHLVDHLARMIASMLHNGALYRANMPDTGKVLPDLQDALPSFEIHVCLTGNGWGMASLIHDVPELGIKQDLTSRVVELIRPYLKSRQAAGAPKLMLWLEGLPLKQNMHPKHVVALGVLSGQTQGGAKVSLAQIQASLGAADDDLFDMPSVVSPAAARSANWGQREILGIPCRAGQGDLPWHAIVESNGCHHPVLQGCERPLAADEYLQWSRALCTAQDVDFPQYLVDDNFDEDLSRDSDPVRRAVRDRMNPFPHRGLLTALLETNLRKRLVRLL